MAFSQNMSSPYDKLKSGIICHDAFDTINLAEALANQLPADTILCLHGDLGSGKTTFTKGIAKALNIKRNITSPTYTIYSLYQGSKRLIHMDAYRMGQIDDLSSIGLEDLLISPFILVIEWPERISNWLRDQSAIHIHFTIQSDHSRFLKIGF